MPATLDWVSTIQLTDAEVISASLVDASRFETIFDRYSALVFAFAAHRVGRQDAWDLVGEVFTRAFAVRGRYDPARSNCLPWLYGIAKNVIQTWVVKMERRPRLYPATSETVVQPYDEADDRLVAQSVSEELNYALRQLEDADRETLLLYALEGLGYAEIAEAMRIPIGTVGSRIHRARLRVMELIPDLEEKTRMMVQSRDEETADG